MRNYNASARSLLYVTVCALLVMGGGCSGSKGGSSPTAPTAVASPGATAPTPGPSPTMKVDVTYYTNDNTTDPDHFILAICPSAGSGSCQGAFTANPAARQPGSITWTGALAPGNYTAMVEMYFADRSIDISFASASGSAPGGVERNSLSFKESNSSPVNTYGYRPCGVTTSFTRRPDLPPLNVSQMYVMFAFKVISGSTSTTC